MDREHRRELYNGFGDAMARGIEFVGTPVLFGFIGFALDRQLGITPALTISLVLFAVAGTVVRAYYAYVAAMTRHEAAGPWARATSTAAPGGAAAPAGTAVGSVAPAGTAVGDVLPAVPAQAPAEPESVAGAAPAEDRRLPA